MTSTSLAARELKRLRERSGLSVREVAAAIDRPPSTYASYEDKFKKRYLPFELAEQLEAVFIGRGTPPITSTDIYALAGVRKGMAGALPGGAQARKRSKQRRMALAGHSPTAQETASIPELAVDAIGGGGGIHDVADAEAVVSEWQIPVELVRSQTDAAIGALRIIRVLGDSMLPDYRPGQRVLVNTDDRLPSPPGVFVVWDGFGLVIKRLEIIPYSDPPTVRLISANPSYGTYERPLADVMVNGRVMGSWQWT